jgi:hypothetical protein
MNNLTRFPGHLQNQGLLKEYFPSLEIIERSWEGWEFQSASYINKFTEQMVCYTRVRDNGVFRETVEVYSGENYVPNSNKRSYSRVYKMDSIPNPHTRIVDILKNILFTRLGNKLITE